MLLFIFGSNIRRPMSTIISIHPMLLFIALCILIASGSWYFNTSHVTVYPCNLGHLVMIGVISIHPMLLFICSKHGILHTENTISIHPMLLFIIITVITKGVELNFNTSHVTVYQAIFLPVHFRPCISIHPMLLFIIHTNMDTLQAKWISIHPMLLFIKTITDTIEYLNKFQYIPCYCLSDKRGLTDIQMINFNTSHVTVYLTMIKGNIISKHISIHPMLLFIATSQFKFPSLSNFNTSHVTVYRFCVYVSG